MAVSEYNTMGKRIDYIDIAKAIGILLVLLGHLIPDGYNSLKSVIYSFHMPLFFILSGMTLKDLNFTIFAKKRFYSVLLPYLLWAAIFSKFSFKNCAYIIYGSNESLQRAGSNAMLWFLVSMFIGSIVSWVIIHLFGGNKKIVAVFAVVLFFISWVANYFHDFVTVDGFGLGLPLALDVSLLSASFILAGNLLPAIQIQKMKLYHKALSGGVLLLTSLLGILEGRSTETGYPQMATYSIGNPLLYWIVGITASVGVILLSSVISDILKEGVIHKVFLTLGRNSMVMFVLHRTLVYQLKDFAMAHSNPVIVVVLWIALTVYSVVAALLIIKICPVLAGKGLPRASDKKG